MRPMRRLLAGSAAGVAGYVVTRLVSGPGGPAADEGSELLGSARGRVRLLRGPRASSLYTEWFPPEEPSESAAGALVLTHGWCVTESIWHLQKLALGRGPDTLVTWDLPGHGHSTPVARGRLTLDVAVDALARVVDAVADPGVVLVGHSLGGVLSVEYLARHPETAARRVRGLVLAATPVMSHSRWARGRWPGRNLRGRLVGRGLQLAVENKLVDRWFAREAGSGDQRGASYRLIRSGFGAGADPRLVRFVRDVAASVPPEVRADTFRAMGAFDLRPALRHVRVPCLVLYGRHDRLVPPDEARLCASFPSRGRQEEFADAGHALFLEEAERFNDVVARFARARLRGGRLRGGRPPSRSGAGRVGVP